MAAPTLSRFEVFDKFAPFASISSGAVIQTLTNAQKLSLPANTSVGTQVKVSDGFVVSGAPAGNGNFWFFKDEINGKDRFYDSVGRSAAWHISDVDGVTFSWHISLDDDNGFESFEDVEYPWEVTSWSVEGSGDPPTITFLLTHPAVQQLAAPSTTEGGVFVSGGTQDGVYVNSRVVDKQDYQLLGHVNLDDPASYSIRWTDSGPYLRLEIADSGVTGCIYYSNSDVDTPDLAGTDKVVMAVSGVAYSKRGTFNGKSYYNKIGEVDSTSLSSIFWSSATWHITNAIGVDLDTSTSAVATPDLATFLLGTVVTNVAWLNAADDTPATITVTSVTAGQIAAGIKYSTNFYTVNGAANGRNKYTDVLGVAPDFTFNGAIWTDGTHNGTGTPAFPWDVTGITITRDDVASEANWQVVP